MTRSPCDALPHGVAVAPETPGQCVVDQDNRLSAALVLWCKDAAAFHRLMGNSQRPSKGAFKVNVRETRRPDHQSIECTLGRLAARRNGRVPGQRKKQEPAAFRCTPQRALDSRTTTKVAEIVREYGAYPGVDKVAGVTMTANTSGLPPATR